MTRLEYVNTREKLMREHGSNSDQVKLLDRQMSMQHTLNAVGNTAIDVSNQTQMGAQRLPTNQLSQSELNEIKWFEGRVETSGAPRTAEKLQDLRDNYTSDDEM